MAWRWGFFRLSGNYIMDRWLYIKRDGEMYIWVGVYRVIGIDSPSIP